MAPARRAQLTDLIGRTDLLEALPGLTARRPSWISPVCWRPGAPAGSSLLQPAAQPHLRQGAAERLKMVEDLLDAIAKTERRRIPLRHPQHRPLGGCAPVRRDRQTHGNQGMAARRSRCNFNGTAGQSFGVWNAGGLEMILEGDANDYVGKGMTGGKLVLARHAARVQAHETPSSATPASTAPPAANCTPQAPRASVSRCATQAPGGGRRAGDHGCEYMTGGIVTVLGRTGVNFAAGMTGGFAYVLDECATSSSATTTSWSNCHRRRIWPSTCRSTCAASSRRTSTRPAARWGGDPGRLRLLCAASSGWSNPSPATSSRCLITPAVPVQNAESRRNKEGTL
jgi:glutamate synthase (NADPH/NADH) large chain